MSVQGLHAAEGNPTEQAIYNATLNLKADITYNKNHYVFIRHNKEGQILGRYGVNNCIEALLLNAMLKIVAYIKGNLISTDRELLRNDAQNQTRILTEGIVYDRVGNNHLKLKISPRLNIEQYRNELSVLLEHEFVDDATQKAIIGSLNINEDFYKQFSVEFSIFENEGESLDKRLKACKNAIGFLFGVGEIWGGAVLDDEENARYRERISQKLAELSKQIKENIEAEVKAAPERLKKLYSEYNASIKTLTEVTRFVNDSAKESCQACIQTFEQLQQALCKPVLDQLQAEQLKLEAELKAANEVLERRDQLLGKVREQIIEISQKVDRAMPEFFRVPRPYMNNVQNLPFATQYRLVEDVQSELKIKTEELTKDIATAEQRRNVLLHNIEEDEKRNKEGGFVSGLLSGFVYLVEGSAEQRQAEMLKACQVVGELRKQEANLKEFADEMTEYAEICHDRRRIITDMNEHFSGADVRKTSLEARRSAMNQFVSALPIAKGNVDPEALFRKLEEGMKLVEDTPSSRVAV